MIASATQQDVRDLESDDFQFLIGLRFKWISLGFAKSTVCPPTLFFTLVLFH